MRIHRFDGGLKLDGHKREALDGGLHTCPLPPKLVLPLSQHAGEPAAPVVAVGEHVLRGQPIGRVRDEHGAHVHASSSGRIIAIETRALPHASDAQGACVVVEPDGEDTWQRLPAIDNWHETARETLLARIRAAGIVGLGGAAFPTDLKLAAPRETLVLNAVECEPWIACDEALLIERAEEVVRGAALLAHLCGATQAIVAIEDSMPAARDALDTALREHPFAGAVLAEVPTRYPAGGERQLIQTLTGNEVPSGGLPRDIGIISHNVGTAYAVWRAVAHGEALTSRIVTVTGPGIARPGNWEVRLGTPMDWLIEQAGGYTETARALLMGGSMMGVALPHDELPVVKACNCLLAMDPGVQSPELPCIRCGECARVCPARLLPQQLYHHIGAQNWEQTEHHALFDCIECGCCDLVCPSHIPLVDAFRRGKTQMRQRAEEHARAEEARLRFERREQRLGREEREHEEQIARRKAEIDRQPMDASEVQAAIERARAKRHHDGDETS